MATAAFTRAMLLAAVCHLAFASAPACAVDLFGGKFFEADGNAADASETITVRYRTTISVTQGDADFVASLRGASLLIELEAKGAADLGSLRVRAKADQQRMMAALYEVGHFAGKVRISIAGRPLDSAVDGDDAPPGEAVVQVGIDIDPGPLFRFGRVAITSQSIRPDASTDTPEPAGLVPGEPARSGLIVKAIERQLKHWHTNGHPFARVARKNVSADHASQTLDVIVEIDPGRPATYGWVNVTGATGLQGPMLLRYSGLRSGEAYSAKDLDKAATRLRKLDAVSSVRVVEGDTADAGGGVPITLSVTERERRFVGMSASLSSVDGGEIGAYWGHRNLFGGAERFKIEGTLSQLGDGGLPALQYLAKASLTKPGIMDIDTDLVAETSVSKERPETYTSHAAKARIGLVRRFSETRSGSVFLAGALTEEEDAFGTGRYALVSVPVELTEDRRDNKLDASQGWRAMVAAEPTVDFAHSAGFLIVRSQLNSYLAVDEGRQLVVAGRVAAASVTGTSVQNVPASVRLYAGGGGSVRGYANRSIGRPFGTETVGGLGLLEASLEVRWRVTPTIGLVPFIDMATVAGDSWPSLDDPKFGAGLGIRYYTALGPLRLDVAAPLDSSPGLADFAFYVGLGQAF